MNNSSGVLLAALAAAFLGLTVGLPAHAAGKVEVSYVQPDQFRDAGRAVIDRERTMGALTQHLQRLAKRLPDGQTLRLEVTDIDLAGEIQPSRRLIDLRVLRGGADWPRMSLRYTLLEGSRTLKSGEARLSDPAYLFSIRRAPVIDSDLVYEKRMLEAWFDEAVVAPR